jgi:hypothetical protein
MITFSGSSKPETNLFTLALKTRMNLSIRLPFMARLVEEPGKVETGEGTKKLLVCVDGPGETGTKAPVKGMALGATRRTETVVAIFMLLLMASDQCAGFQEL